MLFGTPHRLDRRIRELRWLDGAATKRSDWKVLISKESWWRLDLIRSTWNILRGTWGMIKSYFINFGFHKASPLCLIIFKMRASAVLINLEVLKCRSRPFIDWNRLVYWVDSGSPSARFSIRGFLMLHIWRFIEARSFHYVRWILFRKFLEIVNYYIYFLGSSSDRKSYLPVSDLPTNDF